MAQTESGVKASLTRHIGPLPTWGWVAIIGGGIVVYSLWKRHSASAASSNSSQTGTGTATQPPMVFQIYPSSVQTPSPAPSSPAPTGSTPTPPEQPGSPAHHRDIDPYYHSDPRHGSPYVSLNKKRTSLQSGKYQIGGKNYYYHAHPKHGKPYWSLNGKRVNPPSGSIEG